MSITDILTSDILTRVTAVSLTDMLLTVLLSFCTGMFIFYIYQKTFRGVLYSLSFGLSLVALCMISAMLILAVSSNVVLSLGMVGALSIVRFRTAIKDPMDTVFMFWSIVAGIITGAGYVTVAVLATLLLGVLFLVINLLTGRMSASSYLVVLRYTEAGEGAVKGRLNNLGKYKLKSRSLNRDETEMVIEAKLSKKDMDALAALLKNEGVSDVNIISYNGSTLL